MSLAAALCSGKLIAGADCLQSVSGNSKVLDMLDLKLQVPMNYQSINLLRAVEQLAREPRSAISTSLFIQACRSELFVALR